MLLHCALCCVMLYASAAACATIFPDMQAALLLVAVLLCCNTLNSISLQVNCNKLLHSCALLLNVKAHVSLHSVSFLLLTNTL